MELWHAWTDLLGSILNTLALDWGLGAGLAIIVVTVAVRLMLMPLTWTLAWRGALRQAQHAKLAPEIARIRERHASEPRAQMEQIAELYRRHGVSLADGKCLLGGLAQIPVIYGLYRALSNAAVGGRFLWIRDLARPDVLLAIVAALTTAASMAVAPHLSEQTRVMMIVLPAVLCLMAAAHFSSGVGLYWITSNLISTAQTLVLRSRLRRSGLL